MSKHIRSDVFESFIKIAQEQGLISEAEHAEHTETSFPETNPRHDSLSIEQISKLYNNKPPASKEMEYKRNIMEIAHPKAVVISPSYDKLNGLVENENEGQDIRIHISLKQPDGHLINRKYAEKNLALSLVRLANDLDNNGEDELRQLADTCLMQASGRPLRKVAFWPMVAGIAALVGALYAKQHLPFHADGFTADYQKAIGEIDDLLNSNSNWGVGYDYNPSFLQLLNKLKTQLSTMNTEVQKVIPVLDKLQAPRTGKEMMAMGQDQTVRDAANTLQEFEKVFSEVDPFIQGVIAAFGNPAFKQRAIANKGMLSSITDATEILHGGKGLIADDFDDVKHAMQALEEDMSGIREALQAAGHFKQAITQQLQSVQPKPETPADAGAPEAGAKPANPLWEAFINPVEEAAKGVIPSL